MFELLTFISSIVALFLLKPTSVKMFLYKLLIMYIMVATGIQLHEKYGVLF